MRIATLTLVFAALAWAPARADPVDAGPPQAAKQAPQSDQPSTAASAQIAPPRGPRPADVPVPPLPPGELLARLRGKLKVAASTVYEGWPASKAVDGDVRTSWFSASGDAAALKTTPWIEVTFPEDVAIQRVTALGNREAAWLVDYSIVVARLELYDAKGARLAAQGNETAVPTFDIEFRFKAPVAKVRRMRFVSVADQGDRNPYRDIAIGELWAW